MSASSRALVSDVLLAAGALLVPGDTIEDDARLCDATNGVIPRRGRGTDWEAFRVAIGDARTRRRRVDIDSQIWQTERGCATVRGLCIAAFLL